MRHSIRFLSHLPLALMCAFALREGILATAGLEWPFDRDAFRNIAQAQTAADGGFLDDPFFLDEGAFYNPLLAWVVAAFSLASGSAVHQGYTTLGPYVNLLSPIFFHRLVLAWFGPAAATFATFHLLFLNVRLGGAAEPLWTNPTYGAWMLSANLGLPLFCFCLVLLARAVRTGRRIHFAAAGAVCGLTFLAHSGPALLLVVLVGFETLRALLEKRGGRPLARLATLGACAFLVASPFLFSIVGRYGLEVRNPDPFFWRWLPPLPECIPLLRRQLSAFSLLGVIGLVLLARSRGPRVPRRHLLVLIVTSLVFFVMPFVEDRFPLSALGAARVVSQHHFWFYLRLFESALAGYALARLSRGLLRMRRERPWILRRRAGPALALLLVLAGLVVVRPFYRERSGFALGRAARAHPEDDHRDRTSVVSWIRRETGLRDVLLASDTVSVTVVGPAGRKTLALEPNFASQYVDPLPRYRARGALLEALREGRQEAALRLARKWSVSHLVLWRGEPFERGVAASRGLETAYANPSYRVYRIP